MSGNRTTVLAAARADIGVFESPAFSNRQKFSAFWGKPPEAWCADAATYWLKKGGALDVRQSSYCPTLYQEYANVGRAGHSPRVGALVFFRWPGSYRLDHVGLVEAVHSDGSIITIEGNTDSAGGGHGGRVMRQVRRGCIAGYGYPVYDAVAPVVHTTAGHTNPYSRPTALIHLGMSGTGVKYVQWATGFSAQDGIFGPQTQRVVIQWQRAHPKCGAADGIVGPHTIAVMATVRR